MTTPMALADRTAYEALIRPDRPEGAVSLRLEAPGGGVQLAAGDPDLVVGMRVVKVGVFNGVFEVTRDDLDAFVNRFNDLAGTFRPPMRLDHSWSVMDVIGRFEALRVENLPDPTIGDTVVPYLVADWRLVGTKAQKAELRERMTGDHPHLLERSAEFWPYRTNAGAEYPLVFAGCAFVDIPAVEGLGAVTLRRSHGEGAAGAILTHDGNANDERTGTVPEQEQNPTAPSGDGTTNAGDPGTPEAGAVPSTPTPDEAAAPVAGDDPTPDPEDGEEAEPVTPPTLTELQALLSTSTGGNLSADTSARVEAYLAEQVRLRQESASRYETHLSRGVIPHAAQDTVRALLSHEDAAVRDGVAAYLDLVRPPVRLRQEDGVQTSTASGSALDPATATPESASGAGFEEFMALYAQLSTEQRTSAAWQSAYEEKVRLHNAGNR